MRLSIEKKVLLGFAAALVILIAVATVSYLNGVHVLEDERRVAHTHEVLAQLETIRYTIARAESDQRSYILTGFEAFLTSYATALPFVDQEVSALRQLTSDNPTQQQRIADLTPHITQRFTLMEQTVDLYQGQNMAAAIEHIRNSPATAEMAAINDLLDQMRATEQQLLDVRSDQAQQSGLATQLTYGALILIVCAILAVFYRIIRSDIRERQRIGIELRETNATLEKQYEEVNRARGALTAVFNATGEGITLVSPEGKFLSANSRFADLFGCTVDEVVDHSVRQIWKKIARRFADPSVYGELVRGSIPDRERVFTEVVQQSWPQFRELELYSSPVFSDDKKYLGRLYVYRDITQARQAERLKSEFVSMVSHELRTPLTSIKGFVDLLLDDDVGELNEEQTEFLGIVRTNSDRLVALINDILDISRIESGKIDLKPAPQDLEQMVGVVADSLRPQIEAKQQTLTLNLAPKLPLVMADMMRGTQILTNLVSNAHKYTPPGGSITISAYPEGDKVRIDVTDSGVGMSKEEQARLFERFFRANNRATQDAGGTGLGLVITRSLVQMHGGEITVKSAPGQGSTFSFTLRPASEAALVEAPPPLLPPGGRVLVVDDEPDIVNLMRRYLERGGYHVLAAATAQEGLNLARTEHPDLITLDVLLPDADGFTMLEWIKSNSETKAIPVIIVSMMDDEGRGKLLGAIDYLTKPVREKELLERVAAAISGERGNLVLVADDDSSIRALIGEHLRRDGYEVVEAGDGAEAVAMAAERHPALALLDVKMPVMDGISALSALRDQPGTRYLPVIMMTASPGLSESNRSTIEALGSTLLMAKPATAEELAEVIGGRLLVRSSQ